jgi:CsoR family transcriptional regulator, copper-sensing transcriptional repressor
MTASHSLTDESLACDRHTHPDTHAGQEHSHGHVHTESSRRQIVNRLSRIEGHIRGIKTMVQENTDCPEVLIQIAAVRGALDRVSRIILDEHLTQCIARAAQEGNIEAEIQELKAALDRFLPGEKPAKHKVKLK